MSLKMHWGIPNAYIMWTANYGVIFMCVCMCVYMYMYMYVYIYTRGDTLIQPKNFVYYWRQ